MQTVTLSGQGMTARHPEISERGRNPLLCRVWGVLRTRRSWRPELVHRTPKKFAQNTSTVLGYTMTSQNFHNHECWSHACDTMKVSCLLSEVAVDNSISRQRNILSPSKSEDARLTEFIWHRPRRPPSHSTYGCRTFLPLQGRTPPPCTLPLATIYVKETC